MAPPYVRALHGCRIYLDDFGDTGIAPAEVSVGHLICSLVSAVKLAILRPRSDQPYTLVSGECYTLAYAQRIHDTGANWQWHSRHERFKIW